MTNYNARSACNFLGDVNFNRYPTHPSVDHPPDTTIPSASVQSGNAVSQSKCMCTHATQKRRFFGWLATSSHKYIIYSVVDMVQKAIQKPP